MQTTRQYRVKIENNEGVRDVRCYGTKRERVQVNVRVQVKVKVKVTGKFKR